MLLLLCNLWDLGGSLFGTFPLPPEDPLERNIRDAKLFRFRDDQPGDVSGEFLAMRPFLYRSFSYGAAQRRGELPLAQRDAFPRREDVEHHGEAGC